MTWRHRFQEQFDQIQRAMPDVPLALGPDDAAEFLYEKGVVLARDARRPTLVEDTVARQHFTRRLPAWTRLVRRVGPETNRWRRHPDPGRRPGRGRPAAATGTCRTPCALMRDQEHGRGAGWSAATTWCRSPSTAARVTSRCRVLCRAIRRWSRTPCPRATPVSVLVDRHRTHERLQGLLGGRVVHRGRPQPGGRVHRGRRQVDPIDDRGVLQQYVGHGTFIAGLVAAVAPNTRITVRNTLHNAGAISEYELGGKLFEAVSGRMARHHQSLRRAPERLSQHGLSALEPFMEALRAQPAPCWWPPPATTPAPRRSGRPPTRRCPGTRTR